MSFVIAASDRSSGRVSGPSLSGISSFCGVSSVLLAMSLTAGTMSAPPSRSARVADSLKGRLRLPKPSSVGKFFDSINKCAGTSLSFTGRGVLGRHRLEHIIVFGEAHLRPPPMAEIGEPRSGDPGFRHQLN